MKKTKKLTAVLLSLSMIVSSIAITNPTSVSAAKKVTLSAKNLTVKVGQSKKLKLKNNKKKVTWTVTSGKKNISLKSKKKAGVTVVGKKKGPAKVQAKIGKKKYTCKVTVKAKTTATAKPTKAPSPVVTTQPTKAPTTTATVQPTGTPPTETPSAEPTGTPTEPTVTPTETPSTEPTGTPTETPSTEPTGTPTVTSTETPSAEQTETPESSVEPTAMPPTIVDGVLQLHYNKTNADEIKRQIQNSELLVHVIVDEGVTSIEYDTFEDCSNLNSIEIPASVTKISNSAFQYSNLTSIKVADENPYYESRDDNNTLIKKEFTVDDVLLRDVPDNTSSDEYEKKYSTEISGCALIKGNEKTKITDDIVYIGSSVFTHCENLTSVEIPDSVVCIDFNGYISGFSYCKNLQRITVAEDNPVYYSPEGSNAILYKIGQYSHILGMYGKDRLLVGCAGTKIPDYVPELLEGSFWGSGLTSIEIPENVKAFSYAFYASSELEEVKLNAGLEGISVYAFAGCSKLKSINIPDGVTFIGEGAFKDCTNLTSINIPNSVTYICHFSEDSIYHQSSAFAGCDGLTSIVWNGSTYTNVEEFLTVFENR